MKDTLGLPTDAIQRTLPDGGAAHIRLRCLTILSYIMEKFPLMMRTADLSKCLATNVRSRPIPKSLTYIIDYLLRVQGLNPW